MDERPSSDVKAQRNNTSDSKPSEGEKAVKQQVKRVPPDVLCSCPQRCDTRVPAEARTKLYSHFSKLGDHATQNAYLQSYIEMRSVYRRLWAEEEKVRGRLPRRVSCKYRIPISEMPPIESVDFPKPKLITNSKGKETFVMTARGKGKTIEVCQKAFMNVYGITEKRVRLQREKLIDRLRNRSPPPLSPIHHYMDEDLSGQMDEGEEDGTLAVAIVDSFFQNQLWKPEYIGMSKEKIEHIKA
ncbi:uncharacterized protein [Halyomorpha halys]|uniref:uncharacterized protein n=1 Tax=Halyomorpha halys TaxID=286706 RepID=UPI0006D4F167|nr:uncharacterized protein LOC106679552 [Halyomorpha halys]